MKRKPMAAATRKALAASSGRPRLFGYRQDYTPAKPPPPEDVQSEKKRLAEAKR